MHLSYKRCSELHETTFVSDEPWLLLKMGLSGSTKIQNMRLGTTQKADDVIVQLECGVSHVGALGRTISIPSAKHDDASSRPRSAISLVSIWLLQMAM